jgi:Cu2+-exporting ATPase
MEKLKLHFLSYAGIALLMTIVTGVLLPVFGDIPAIYHLTDERVTYGLMTVSALFILWTSVQMLRQTVRELKANGTGSVILVAFGQVMLLSVIIWRYMEHSTMHDLFMGVTLPIYFLSICIVYLTLNWSQNQEEQGRFPANMQRKTRALTAVIALMGFCSLAIFAYRGDIQVALLVSGSLFMVADPRWPMLRVSQLRKKEIRRLSNHGIDVLRDASLDQLPGLKNVIVEKQGILTDQGFKVYSVNSLTNELSEYDVLTIVASLEADLSDEFSRTVVEFAKEHGVYPVPVAEQTVLPSVGVQGEVFETEYALVMASYAHQQQYKVNANRLEAILALGNSVRLLVHDDIVIGAVNYGESFRRDLGDLDQYFKTYGMDVRLATTDTMGSVRPVREIMKSVVTVQADLTAAQQYAQQASWAEEVPTLFLTTGAVPAKVDPAVVIKSGDNERSADIMLAEMEQMSVVHQTALKMRRINRWTAVRWTIWTILLVATLFTTELGVNEWLIAPNLAILIRAIMTLILNLLEPELK